MKKYTPEDDAMLSAISERVLRAAVGIAGVREGGDIGVVVIVHRRDGSQCASATHAQHVADVLINALDQVLVDPPSDNIDLDQVDQ